MHDGCNKPWLLSRGTCRDAPVPELSPGEAGTIRRGPPVNGPLDQSELSGTEPRDITLTVVDEALSGLLSLSALT
ncbi:hypothetical protein CORC01_14184 [Colletotrichum orchidophilum]|uniref:Uncharacterized protein n=1 Tax=Colletotrichum orchidophilum TaxID=1209926 RepID=A0A1G4AN50_9PEZI|nr:uncharacterized protein CORC01_14184 [Colletotrichum orchidophilum]OHE90515.1 hypothetical protein CORC01_14184 [Colletotrichum orchidophilum]